MTHRIYCIDTEIVVRMLQWYPVELFPTLWGRIDGLFEQGRLKVHRQVLEELLDKADGRAKAWKESVAVEHIVEIDDDQQSYIATMASQYSQVKDQLFRSTEVASADYYLIACWMLPKRSRSSTFQGIACTR